MTSTATEDPLAPRDYSTSSWSSSRQRLVALDQRLATLDQRLAAIDQRLATLGQRLVE